MAMKPIKVSQLNSYIGRIIGTDPLLGNISVTGEISNLNYHSSGHVYFSLKDENSTVKCFLPYDKAENMRFELDEGMEIIASGYISVFERGGYYSLTVKDIELCGMGALALAFEKIKKKLDAEGIFSPEHKKELPFFPEKIALVTSPTGAAVEDMLRIIKNKNNIVDVLIYPVLVQGPQAAGEIAAAIDDLNNNFTDIDLIIAGRGGGSAEDLWAFNEEIVARAIFNSKIPVISAVGHEIDVTISDFAADKRAETPTAAANMAVPDIGQLLLYIEDLKEKSLRNLLSYLDQGQYKIDLLKSKIDSLNPRRIIESGYGALLNEDRTLITSIKTLKQNDTITILLGDGEVKVRVEDIKECTND